MKDSRRARVAETIRQARVSAIIRTDDQGLAGDAMQAAVDGGFHVVEFTLTTPGALSLVERFSVAGSSTCSDAPVRMNKPMTSWPCSRRRWAATELSTPPLIASTTRAMVGFGLG